jgi:OOP family OmpA-OmpF porin
MFFLLFMLYALGGCANFQTSEVKEACMFGTAVAGASIGGGVGNLGGAAAGTAAGALIGAFICPQGVAAPAPAAEPRPTAEVLDSDGDGVPDFRDWCAGTPPGAKVDERGCEPVAAPVPAGVTLMVLEGVNFAFDSAAISPDSERILDEAVRALNANPGVRVRIEGHTDSTGSEAYNQGLSERRARAVREYLEAKGIDPSRLSTAGYGESRPVASNDTREGRTKNRRVEFIVQ